VAAVEQGAAVEPRAATTAVVPAAARRAAAGADQGGNFTLLG